MKRYTWIYAVGLILTVGLGFWSCQKEPVIGPEGGGKERPKEMAYFSIGIAPTGAFGITDPGTPEESRVSSVRVVLYDGSNPAEDNPEVLEVFDFEISSKYNDDESAIIGYEQPEWIEEYGEEPHLYRDYGADRFVTYARAVPRQDYRMLVIINPTEYNPPVPENIVKTKNDYRPEEALNIRWLTEKAYDDVPARRLADIQKPIRPLSVIDGSQAGLAAEGYFFMTNHQELIPVPKEQLKSTPAESNENPFFVNVERAVAKVTVKKDDSFKTLPEGVAASDWFSWELDITNQWTYWYRRMDYMKSATGDPTIKEQLNVGDRENYYAIDPNFYGQSEVNGGSQKDRDEHFYYLANDKYRHPDDPLRRALQGEGWGNDIQYAYENTMQRNEMNPDVTTRAVISCRYSPNTSLVPLGTSYFVFDSKLITQTDMETFAVAWDESQLPVQWQGTGLWEAMQQTVSEGYNLINPVASFDLNGIRFYKDGISYYLVPIVHFPASEAGGVTGYGHYGVVRNNFYTVNILSVDGPGVPNIPSTGTYISADITVAPWMVKNQYEEIGNGNNQGEYKYTVTYRFFCGGYNSNRHNNSYYEAGVGMLRAPIRVTYDADTELVPFELDMKFRDLPGMQYHNQGMGGMKARIMDSEGNLGIEYDTFQKLPPLQGNININLYWPDPS